MTYSTFQCKRRAPIRIRANLRAKKTNQKFNAVYYNKTKATSIAFILKTTHRFLFSSKMENLSSSNEAEGYKQRSLSVQKVDGEIFIQTDVCPQAGDTILDLGCGTGELSAYLAELVGL